MATSSITETLVITDPKQAEAFADAVETCLKHPMKRTEKKLWFVESKEEFARLMKGERICMVSTEEKGRFLCININLVNLFIVY